MARTKKEKPKQQRTPKRKQTFKRKIENLAGGSKTRRRIKARKLANELAQQGTPNTSNTMQSPCFYIDTTGSTMETTNVSPATSRQRRRMRQAATKKQTRGLASCNNLNVTEIELTSPNKPGETIAISPEKTAIAVTPRHRRDSKHGQTTAEKVRRKYNNLQNNTSFAKRLKKVGVSPNAKAQLCTHYVVPQDVAKCWFERIKQHLRQPEAARAYHNWDEMIMRKLPHLQHCKPSIVLAALFQYYVYDRNRSCTKENCAAFEEFCQDAQIDDAETKATILSLLGDKSNDTYELHSQIENDANLLQDLDLVILAASAADYEAYTKLLRQEYGSMNDESYKQMRLKVLETLLMIPNIFATPEYQAKFEAAARENIKREINILKTQGN